MSGETGAIHCDLGRRQSALMNLSARRVLQTRRIQDGLSWLFKRSMRRSANSEFGASLPIDRANALASVAPCRVISRGGAAEPSGNGH
jgi:hypothetical protein